MKTTVLRSLLLFALLAGAAQAATISLVVLAPDELVFQQTAASPCVIGGNNCLNGSLPYTLAGSGGAGSLFDETSPLYTLDQVLDVTLASSFRVALDYNDTSDPQRLDLFQAIYYSDAAGTVVLGTDTFNTPTSLKTNANGVGFSDFILEGFMIPDGAQSVKFTATWFNNDGADRYFLIGGDETPNPVPEPSTSLLFLSGLAAAAFIRSRRTSKT